MTHIQNAAKRLLDATLRRALIDYDTDPTLDRFTIAGRWAVEITVRGTGRVVATKALMTLAQARQFCREQHVGPLHIRYTAAGRAMREHTA